MVRLFIDIIKAQWCCIFIRSYVKYISFAKLIKNSELFCAIHRIRDPVVQHNGTESDSLRTVAPSQVVTNVSTVTNIATFYDMKICYSTVLGYNAFRDPIEGSWYIQILCKVFGEHAHDTHLEDLLKIIGLHMNNKRTEGDQLQTVSNEDRGFNKILYFNPGFYG